jgi:2-polyprenyl-3-methyl-5-hydroxy-6-metoxy-1,4-benzoquinol methylase
MTAPLFEIEQYVPQAGNIIDIGCGSGIFSNLMCIMSGDRSVTGYDISSRRIEQARKTIVKGRHLSFHVQDAGDTVCSGFSTVTVIDLLHHITYEEQDRLLQKIYGDMEAPGELVLKDLEKRPLWKYAYHYVQDSIAYRSRLYFRSSEEMEKLLNDIGFRVTVVPLESPLPYPHVIYICRKEAASAVQ